MHCYLYLYTGFFFDVSYRYYLLFYPHVPCTMYHYFYHLFITVYTDLPNNVKATPASCITFHPTLMFNFDSDDEETGAQSSFTTYRRPKRTWRQHVFKTGKYRDQTLLQVMATGAGRSYLRFLQANTDGSYPAIDKFIAEALDFYGAQKKIATETAKTNCESVPTGGDEKTKPERYNRKRHPVTAEQEDDCVDSETHTNNYGRRSPPTYSPTRDEEPKSKTKRTVETIYS